jgi:hypothetical protein
VGKKCRVISVALSIAVLGGLAWFVLAAREPSYQGKSLGVWLDQYTHDGDKSARDAGEMAVREIGTNAIPTLLRFMRKTDSPWKLKLIALIQRQKAVKIHFITAYDRNYQAFKGFGILGPKASGAVPALMEIYRHNSENVKGSVPHNHIFLGSPPRPSKRASVSPHYLHKAERGRFVKGSVL